MRYQCYSKNRLIYRGKERKKKERFCESTLRTFLEETAERKSPQLAAFRDLLYIHSPNYALATVLRVAVTVRDGY